MCGNEMQWDRTGPDATNGPTLSRWRHGFESRWDCSSFGLVSGVTVASSGAPSGNFVRRLFGEDQRNDRWRN